MALHYPLFQPISLASQIQNATTSASRSFTIAFSQSSLSKSFIHHPLGAGFWAVMCIMPLSTQLWTVDNAVIIAQQLSLYTCWTCGIFLAASNSSKISALWQCGGMSDSLVSEGVSHPFQNLAIAARTTLQTTPLIIPVIIACLIRRLTEVGYHDLGQILSFLIMYLTSAFTVATLSARIARYSPSISTISAITAWIFPIIFGTIIEYRLSNLHSPISNIFLWLFSLVPPFDLAFVPAHLIYLLPIHPIPTLLTAAYLLLFAGFFSFFKLR